LDSGGKVVWIGNPPMLTKLIFAKHGQFTGMAANWDDASKLIGVPFHGALFDDANNNAATDAGRDWGLGEWWLGGWIAALRAAAEHQVSDMKMAEAGERFPVKTPDTKEGCLYRRLFEQHFGWATWIACSTAVALEWDAAFKKIADPSGRAVGDIHVAGAIT
jgi:hypothetical protein